MTETKHVAWKMPLPVWGRLASLADQRHTTVAEIIKQSLTSIAATGQVPERAEIPQRVKKVARPLSDQEQVVVRRHLTDGYTQEQTAELCEMYGFSPTVRQVRSIHQAMKKEAE